MKPYAIEKETPLKFHKLYLCILFLRIMIGISVVGIFAVDDPPNIFLIGYNALCALLCAVACWGLFMETAYGWYANMLYILLGTAYNLYLAIWSFLYNAEQFMTQLPARVVCLPFLFLTAIYYIKRKPLFFPQKYNVAPTVSVSEPANVPSEPAETPLAAAQIPTAVMNFCPNCGKRLKPDYSFCPNCGTPRV